MGRLPGTGKLARLQEKLNSQSNSAVATSNEADELIKGSRRLTRKYNSVMMNTEDLITALGTGIERAVHQAVRNNADRIFCLAVLHEHRCTSSSCALNLTSKHGRVIATRCLEYTIQSMCQSDALPGGITKQRMMAIDLQVQTAPWFNMRDNAAQNDVRRDDRAPGQGRRLDLLVHDQDEEAPASGPAVVQGGGQAPRRGALVAALGLASTCTPNLSDAARGLMPGLARAQGRRGGRPCG